MRESVLRYLNIDEPTADLLKTIDEVIEEVKQIADFRYIYQERKEMLPFLENEEYKKLLSGCHSYVLVATTLGFEIDRRIKYYQVTDPAKALIFDAASSAYIVELADEYENIFKNRTFRFCPGYMNTSLNDNKEILDLLKDLKIGISVLESKMLVPAKSMVGIIGLGKNKEKNCEYCLVKNCMYKEEGKVCFKR